jgi:hypothetical protein
MTSYNEMFKEKYGAESDQSVHLIYPEVVVVA